MLSGLPEKRTLHSAKSVIEHRALTTHNDPVEHFLSNHGDFFSNQNQRVLQAILEIQSANGSYIDVHAWQFVPKSFALLVKQIFELGLSRLKIEAIFGTAPNTQEFFAVLTKIAHKSNG